MRWMPARKGLGTLLIVAGAALLVACGSGDAESDALLHGYQRHLADRLELAPPVPAAPGNIGAFPERRDRLASIPETRAGLLNVYALRECHITTLVAERNSALGRVAPASQQWRYELTLWQRLQACLESDVPARLGEADLARLESLAATKGEQLPRAAWNGLFGSDEWAGNFTRVSGPLAPDALAPPPAQREALTYLHDLSTAPLSDARIPDPEALESHLNALRERPYTAELLRTLMLATQRLVEASALIRHALERHDACRTPALSAELEGPGERPAADWLAALEQAADAWLGDLTPLFSLLDSPPEAVANYHDRWLSEAHPEAPLPAFRSALAEHQALRKAHAERCR